MDTLQRMWGEIQKIHGAANLDARDYQARMYKGIKMVRSESGIRVYSAETDFYREITIWFDKTSSSFMDCAHEYLKHKYLNKLDEVERRVKEEINSTKNHKRVAALKVRRTNLLNKYNEINSKEATGR